MQGQTSDKTVIPLPLELVLNQQPVAADLELDEKLLLIEIRQPMAAEFNWSDFLSIGFSHQDVYKRQL